MLRRLMQKLQYFPRHSHEKLKEMICHTPVLVILGEEDKLLFSRDLGELYKATFPDHEVHIWPEVGHLPFFEEPEKTRDAILNWVKKYPPRYEPVVGNIAPRYETVVGNIAPRYETVVGNIPPRYETVVGNIGVSLPSLSVSCAAHTKQT